MTAVEYLFETLWDCPKDKLTWYSILEKAKEMEYKQEMDAMQKGMELQKKENNRIGFRERNGLLSSQTEISDEEIEKSISYDSKDPYVEGYINGAKWYKEQLKKKQ